jgi:hypothetical protein
MTCSVTFLLIYAYLSVVSFHNPNQIH